MTLEAVGVLLATRRCPGVELSSQPRHPEERSRSLLCAQGKNPRCPHINLLGIWGRCVRKCVLKKALLIAKSTMQLCWPRNSGLHYDLCSRVAAAAAAALGTRMVQSKKEQCVE